MTMSENPISSRRSQWFGIISTGFLVVLVNYSGPLLIYLNAAQAMNVPEAVFSSWIFAISMAAGITTLVLSIVLRAPVATAWSAPGTVLLISIGTQLPFAEIVGAYVMTAAAVFLLGLSGLFDRLVRLIPAAVAHGMMAGILFGFGIDAMGGIVKTPFIVALFLSAYFALQVLAPRSVMLVLLAMGMAVTWQVYGVNPGSVGLTLAEPQFTLPRFSLEATLSLALPLILTTLTGQFLPGLTILHAHGYKAPARPILLVTSLASAVSAMFGGITTALAAISLSLCAGPEAHPDPRRRWLAAIAVGIFFCLGGLLAGSIGQLLTLLPGEIIALLAGLALLAAVRKSISDLVTSQQDVLAGLVTFTMTTADFSLWGIGSAFWGVAAGAGAVAITRLSAMARPS